MLQAAVVLVISHPKSNVMAKNSTRLRPCVIIGQPIMLRIPIMMGSVMNPITIKIVAAARNHE